MPKKTRPATSGYARLAQADEERGTAHGYSDVSDDDDAAFNARTLSPSRPQFAPIQPNAPSQMHLSASASQSPSNYRRKSGGGPRRRHRSNSSGVDIKAINARLERWAEDITSKFKIHKVKGKTTEEEQLEIHHSVFQAPDGMRPLTMEELSYDEGADGRMTKLQFDDIVESVRIAIEQGVHPKMISQGSSGSYFARNTDGKVVGVFKPKDEEPYASRNPKWTKWIHRNLFPCFFGRACLIPNLSYVSEAAAYVLDARLKTNLVPYTDIVYLSSKSFFYDFWDRRSYWRGKKPLPAKVGSFQVFLKGFKDANIFLRENPWPDQVNTFRPSTTPRRRQKPWSEACQPSGVESDDEADENEPDIPSPIAEEPEEEEQTLPETPKVFRWTETLKQSFREELEKLVILDYIMRNTDRGLDNWMVKVDWETEEVSIVSEPMKMNGNTASYFGQEEESETRAPRPVDLSDTYPYRRQEGMFAVSRTGTPSNMNGKVKQPTMSLGAIDNSLSWPWKHPDAWRSFPFGWLFLPVSLIGQPFSKKTRDHFLPLLTSTIWWSDTQMALRRVFSQDSDFKESMFARQIAVMKGQAWNVVETLKTADHGPLELTRRTRVCVWDDLVDVPVAIPLRVPSTEMSRRRLRDYSDDVAEEEMDISAAVDNNPSNNTNNENNDLLGMGSPTSDLPNPNRFELSRDPSIFSGDEGTAPINGKTAKQSLSSSLTLPPRQTPNRSLSKTRGVPARNHSFDIPRRTSNFARRGSNVSFLGIYGNGGTGDDDLEGDLGFQAAEGMEGQERKVIVERLETVKARNPVFTWC